MAVYRFPVISDVPAGTVWRWVNRTGHTLYIQAMALSPISSPPTIQMTIAGIPWFCAPPGGTSTGPVNCPEQPQILYNAFSYQANYEEQEIPLPPNRAVEIDASQSSYGLEVFLMMVSREGE